MEIGEYINKYLIEHDLSIRQFGRMSGISHAYIANIVNGKTSRGTKPVLSIKKIEQIASAMGMDVNQFLKAVDVDIEWGQSQEPDETDELARRLQILRDRPDLGVLLDVGADTTPEEVDALISFWKRTKGENVN